jgi:uncharacterized protein (DUF1499 family)
MLIVLKWVAIFLLVLVVGAVAAGRAGWLQGTAPGDLGVRDGKLKGLSDTDNSVSSQADLYPKHPQRQYAAIAPLALRGSGPETIAKLQTIVESMEGSRLVKSEAGYLYAQYTTPLMKFVDDVEFWFDPVANVIQVRSASRIGKGDRGLNRQRIEDVRALLSTR